MADLHATGISLFNTAAGRIEPLRTAERNLLRLYVCGPTTYTHSHIGHARTYVVYDLLKRVLAARGVRTRHAQNFTDMEEAIARRAGEEGLPPFDLARKYAQAYLADMEALRVARADVYPLASAHVSHMVEMVQALVGGGQAYLVDCREKEGKAYSDVYFDTAKAPRFGHLIGRTLEQVSTDLPRRGDRRNPADFALWKPHNDWGVTFPSPWGDGRPGWHVECAAMATAALGGHFDAHGGGIDLVFPHHESEAAIAETIHGAPYARHWLHNGFVTMGRAKMSKSRGNYLTIREALALYPAEGLRRWLLSAHWRDPLDYDPAQVAEHVEATRRAAGVVERLKARAAGAKPDPDGGADPARGRFDALLADNLQTPQALAELDALVADLEGRADRLSPSAAAAALATLRGMGEQLGLLWAA